MAWLSIASPPCVADDFGGEIVALNLDTGYYYSLPGLAGGIWRDLAAGNATQDIVGELEARSPALGRDASQFISELVKCVSTPEQNCSSWPEQKCTTEGIRTAPIGVF